VPAARSDDGPNCLDQAKGPCALKEPISRAEKASAGKCKNEPMAAVLEGVAYQHRRDREETEERQTIHVAFDPPEAVRRQGDRTWIFDRFRASGRWSIPKVPPPPPSSPPARRQTAARSQFAFPRSAATGNSNVCGPFPQPAALLRGGVLVDTLASNPPRGRGIDQVDLQQ
jgi:hypothetical protein